MDKQEFVVRAQSHVARLVVGGDGSRAAVAFGAGRFEGAAAGVGRELWGLIRAEGVSPEELNAFDVFTADDRLVATLRPVLEGARVMWLVLYRIDKASSAFRALGSRQRLGDALELCAEAICRDVALPHKP